jgi:hypothetical protein
MTCLPSPQDGLSLLHRAVRSGCPDLVRGVLAWGQQHGYAWPIARGGPAGITPLHLSALLDDDGVVALMLLDAHDTDLARRDADGGDDGNEAGSAATSASASAGGGVFTSCFTRDGVSPFHLAFQMGHWGLDRVLGGLGFPRLTSVVEQQLQPSGWQLLRDATEAAAAAAAAEAAAAKAAAAGKQQRGSGATAAASSTTPSSSKPLKERHTSVLDACLYCQSTLPPLLLSIKAKCAGCGERQPCVEDQPGTPPAADAGRGASAAGATNTAAAGRVVSSSGRILGKRSAPDAAAVSPEPAVLPYGGGGEPPAGCAHGSGKVLSVTALCQTCHANRVLEVA